jgi:hypothetical protein
MSKFTGLPRRPKGPPRNDESIVCCFILNAEIKKHPLITQVIEGGALN